MRRFQALLIVAGLAATPASVIAGPKKNSHAPPDATVEKFEWSSSSKGRLGVMVMSLTPELRAYFGAANDRGVLVAHVEPESAASKSGIEVGDVIVEVKGQPIGGAMDVIAALGEVKKGQDVAIGVIRDKQPVSLRATMTEDPQRSFDSKRLRELMHGDPFGSHWFDELFDADQPARKKT